MSTIVTRHFATVDGRWGTRQVHYRRAGQGPAVLLLHQSPQSSREMVELAGEWARHFTVIAPDTPGYGQSDPLPGGGELTIADLALALREFVDAIGLRRFGIYGYHTGSSIGLWLAVAHPERVTAVAANGLVNLNETERASILRDYLPPIVPGWDGAHLAWLWARVREQLIFFPWYDARAGARMDFDLPPAARLQAGMLEFIRSGEHYATAYRAAFESRPDTVMARLRTPLLVTATPTDPLREHLQRLGPLPAGVTLSPADGTPDALARSLAHLLAHAGDPAPTPVATRPVAGRMWNAMVSVSGGQARVRVSLEGGGEPVYLCHDAASSAEAASRLAAELLGRRPVIIPDLPGHGESSPAELPTGPTPREAADRGLEALHALGVGQAVVAGQGVGALVAMEAAARGNFPRRRLALLDVPLLDEAGRVAWREHGLRAIEPEWHGGHLLQAWHQVRDGRLFFPWFARSRAAIRRTEPDLHPGRLQLDLRDLLIAEGAWQNLWRAALDTPLEAALGRLEHAAIGAAAGSGWRAATLAAAGVNARIRHQDLPDSPDRWLPALLAGLP